MKLTEVEHSMVREWISAILKNKQYDHLNPIEGAQKWIEQYREKFGIAGENEVVVRFSGDELQKLANSIKTEIEVFIDGRKIKGIDEMKKELGL